MFEDLPTHDRLRRGGGGVHGDDEPVTRVGGLPRRFRPRQNEPDTWNPDGAGSAVTGGARS